jgi:hypothetical protein
MASLYSTKITASGGRHGSIRSEDGLLDLKLALPRVLGGKGDDPGQRRCGDVRLGLLSPADRFHAESLGESDENRRD